MPRPKGEQVTIEASGFSQNLDSSVVDAQLLANAVDGLDILTRFVADETEFLAAVSDLNAAGGGLIVVTDAITLTAHRTLDLSNIIVQGQPVGHYAGTPPVRLSFDEYIITLEKNGCYFRDMTLDGNLGDELVARAVDSFTAPSTITLEAGVGDKTALYHPGMKIVTTGATNGANNGTFTVVSSAFGTNTVITIVESSLVTEAASPATARSGSQTLFKAVRGTSGDPGRTYQFERCQWHNCISTLSAGNVMDLSGLNDGTEYDKVVTVRQVRCNLHTDGQYPGDQLWGAIIELGDTDITEGNFDIRFSYLFVHDCPEGYWAGRNRFGARKTDSNTNAWLWHDGSVAVAEITNLTNSVMSNGIIRTQDITASWLHSQDHLATLFVCRNAGSITFTMLGSSSWGNADAGFWTEIFRQSTGDVVISIPATTTVYFEGASYTNTTLTLTRLYDRVRLTLLDEATWAMERMGRHVTSHQRAGGDELELDSVSGATYPSLWDFAMRVGSAGSAPGSYITDAGGGNIDVAAGTGYIRQTDAHAGILTAFDWSAALAQAIPADTTRFVGIEWNAGSPQVSIRTTFNWDEHTDFALGSVVNEGGTLHILNNPQIAEDAISHIYHRFLDTRPLERGLRAGGLIIGETGTRNLTMTAGELYDALNEFAISAIDTSGSDTFDAYYGSFTKVAAQTQWDNLQYDNAGTLTALTANRYGVHWVYIEADGQLVLIYGKGNYTSVALAEAEPAPSSVPARLLQHGKLIGRLIFQQNAGTAEEIDSVFETTFETAAVTVHNNLSGLQGGTAAEYYHLTAARHTDLTDGGESTLHYHAADRARANHTGTQLKATISDFAHATTHADGAADELEVEDLATSGNQNEVPVAQSDGSLTMTDLFEILAATKMLDYLGDMFATPNVADWGLNSPAAIIPDPTNASINVGAFDDTTEEGVGMEAFIPTGATDIIFRLEHRAETGPTGDQTVDWRLRFRKVPNNAAIPGSWTVVDMPEDTIPSGNVYYHYTTRAFKLSTIGMDAGARYQLEWSRYVAGTDTLVDDWYCRSCKVYLKHDNIKWYPADTLQSAGTDWSITANAPIATDSNNAALKCRRHSDTTEEGSGIKSLVPAGMATLTLHTISRAEVGPTGAQGVGITFHYRTLGDNGAVGSWVQYDLPVDASMPTTTEYWQYDSWVLTLATLSTPIVPGTRYQFQITRNPADAGDTLVNDWDLLDLGIEYN